MAANKKVIIWGKEQCSHCAKVKSFLDSHGISYESLYVDDKDYLREVLNVKYGVRLVPVVEVGEGNTYEAVTNGDLVKLGELLGLAAGSGEPVV